MNILILNVHSALNLGDDAIMHTTIRSLQDRFPGANITIAANDPDSWLKYEQIEVSPALCTWAADCRLGMWRKRFYLTPFVILFLCLSASLFRLLRFELHTGSIEKDRLLAAYYKADLILSCGGGNFYAHGPISPGFVWNLITVGFALGLTKSVVMLPQSIGPIKYRWQRFAARIVFNHVDTLMVREPESEKYVKSTLRLKQSPILIPDLAFGLPYVERRLPNGLSMSEKKLKIGLTIIDRGSQNPDFLQQESYEEAICSLISTLDQESAAEIFLFVQCYGPSADQDDRIITYRIFDRMKDRVSHIHILDKFKDSMELKSTIKAMDTVIGTRMHTGIFALSSEVPVLLIGYQPKACGMMNYFGLPQYCCNIDEVTAERLGALVNQLLTHLAGAKREISTNLKKTQDILDLWVQFLDNKS